MLKARIVTAIFLLAGLLGALFFLPEHGWIALCALICAGAAWEWGALAGWNKKVKIAYAAALGAMCFVLASLCSWSGLCGTPQDRLAFAVKLSLVAVAFWLLVVPFWLKYKWSLGKWNSALTGCIVLLPPFLMFIFLRSGSPVAVLLASAPVWIADIAAYFSGRAFGHRKLAPSISPGKTWAGAVGALFGVMVYFGVYLGGGAFESSFTPTGSFEQFAGFLMLVIVLSIGFTALSIEGDLFESLLKRQAGVKDSGHLLPGHGGILDRIDSLTSTLPLWPAISFLFIRPPVV